ncbi:MAG: helix-turn-helix transcriptional regulator [Blastochloris sp.]|nr:helix-turn-helix transcriptional regulator [Blastochloris sp.]
MTIRPRVNVLLAEHNLQRAQAGEKPISVRSLAKATGIAHSSLVNLINNRVSRIDFDTLDKLMRYFGTTDMNEVLARDEDESEGE